MGLYEDRLLPHIIDRALASSEVTEHRAEITVGLHGHVVELGYGSGLNQAVLPAEVTLVSAVEPSAVAMSIATKRLERSPSEGLVAPVELIGLDGASIPLPDRSVPCVLSTFTLCTIVDLDTALAEAFRVLKPGGTFHYLEHGRHLEPSVQRFQDRWNPVQRRLFGGCNVNREISTVIDAAGFLPLWQSRAALRGPRFVGSLYKGVVKRPLD